jgi:hypothetical protein
MAASPFYCTSPGTDVGEFCAAVPEPQLTAATRLD